MGGALSCTDGCCGGLVCSPYSNSGAFGGDPAARGVPQFVQKRIVVPKFFPQFVQNAISVS